MPKRRETLSLSLFLSLPSPSSSRPFLSPPFPLSKGVIWRGDSVIEGVPATLDMLRAAGKRLVFVTNNSTKSRAGYLKKFTDLGLNVQAEEIYSSSYAAAAYLQSIDFPADKKVYIIGEQGIADELDLAGIKHCGGPEDAGKEVALKPGYAMPHDADVGAVVVGFDRHLSYYKIQYATLCISENPGCHFIATNTDARTHLTGKRVGFWGEFFFLKVEKNSEKLTSKKQNSPNFNKTKNFVLFNRRPGVGRQRLHGRRHQGRHAPGAHRRRQAR